MTRPRPSPAAIGGRRAVAESIRSGRARRVLVASGARRTEGLRSVLEEANRSDVEVEWVEPASFGRLGLDDHQGVAALLELPRELDERELASVHGELVVVLDGITDPQNLGACARCAEAAGAAVLVARRRRAAPVSAAAIRASAGALLHLPLARVPNLTRALGHLKDRGFLVVGLDHRADLTVHDAPPPEGPVALVIGAEDIGISRLVREACDLLISIPMAGKTASLNASAALAVGLFAYAARRGPSG